MLTPMRSFTLDTGFWLSSFATTSATHPSVTLFTRTSGVWPINSATSFAILMATHSSNVCARKFFRRCWRRVILPTWDVRDVAAVDHRKDEDLGQTIPIV